jgi:heme-degrading monooxygenase HmoA
MLVIVFRSRLKPGLRDEYVALVDRMAELARTMPGYFSHKGFFADDGERVTIVEFEHEEGLRAWRCNPEHVAAQKLAREKYYTEYHVQVCTLDLVSQFKADEAAVPAVPS